MPGPQTNGSYGLDLTFRSVFTPGDEYSPREIELPPHRQDQVYKLVDLQFKKSLVAQAVDTATGIINLDMKELPEDLLMTIRDAFADTAASDVAKAAGGVKTKGLPVNAVTGLLDLPGDYSVLFCMDERNAVTGYGFQASVRLLAAGHVVDFSLIFANPGPRKPTDAP
jgi:hypothetical protein